MKKQSIIFLATAIMTITSFTSCNKTESLLSQYESALAEGDFMQAQTYFSELSELDAKDFTDEQKNRLDSADCEFALLRFEYAVETKDLAGAQETFDDLFAFEIYTPEQLDRHGKAASEYILLELEQAIADADYEMASAIVKNLVGMSEEQYEASFNEDQQTRIDKVIEALENNFAEE